MPSASQKKGIMKVYWALLQLVKELEAHESEEGLIGRLGYWRVITWAACVVLWVCESVSPSPPGAQPQPISKVLGLVHGSTMKRDWERAPQRTPQKTKQNNTKPKTNWGLENDTYDKRVGNFCYLVLCSLKEEMNDRETLRLFFKYMCVSVPKNGDPLVSISIENERVRSSKG